MATHGGAPVAPDLRVSRGERRRQVEFRVPIDVGALGPAARGWVACAGGCLALLPLACRLPGILPRDRGFRQSSKPRILDRLLFLPAFPSRGPWVSVEPVTREMAYLQGLPLATHGGRRRARDGRQLRE